MKQLIKFLTICCNISTTIASALGASLILLTYLHMEPETTIVFVFFVVVAAYALIIDEAIIKLKKEIRKHD